MELLIITGDRSFKSGHPRFDVQAEAVSRMEAVYFGPGALMPRIPKGSFNVVSAQDPFIRSVYGLCVAHLLGARFNVQVHADISAEPLWKRIVARFVLRSADSVRAVSHRVSEQIVPHVRVPVAVVPVYVDLTPFRSVSRSPETPPVILWVGRFEKEKDPFRAVRVFSEITKRGSAARLVMLGGGSLARQLKEAAKGLAVEFPGWQKDVTPYLAKASLLLSTSRAESWGASIVEALAAGVPVVAPDVGIAKDAGAIVVPYAELPDAVIRALSEGARGTLALNMLSRSDWQKAWLQSL